MILNSQMPGNIETVYLDAHTRTRQLVDKLHHKVDFLCLDMNLEFQYKKKDYFSKGEHSFTMCLYLTNSFHLMKFLDIDANDCRIWTEMTFTDLKKSFTNRDDIDVTGKYKKCVLLENMCSAIEECLNIGNGETVDYIFKKPLLIDAQSSGDAYGRAYNYYIFAAKIYKKF